MTAILAPSLKAYLQNLMSFSERFFFIPAKAEPLAIFRIGLSLLLLWQAFLLQPSYFYLFARVGLIQGELSGNTFPNFNLLLDRSVAYGLNENQILIFVGILYLGALVLLLFGLFTRGVALLVWFLHWSFVNTGYSGAYGADMYAHIFLFYLIFIPSGDTYSLDRFFNRTSGQPSYQARLGLRVLQLHMCISYLASGLEKASGQQWWNGEVVFKALNTPGYSLFDLHWMAKIPAIPIFLGWTVLIIEIFYCIMIWPRVTRFWWVLATCLLHLGIVIFLSLSVFGILMCIPTLALFAVSYEPRKELDAGSLHYQNLQTL